MPPIRIDDTDAQVGPSASPRRSRREGPQPALIIGAQAGRAPRRPQHLEACRAGRAQGTCQRWRDNEGLPDPLSIRYTAPDGESAGLSGPVVGGPAPYGLAAGGMVPLRQA